MMTGVKRTNLKQKEYDIRISPDMHVQNQGDMDAFNSASPTSSSERSSRRKDSSNMSLKGVHGDARLDKANEIFNKTYADVD